MASLKEVKGRIVSVQSTQKITLAMKMVASAKLHRAQSAVENIRIYYKQLYSLYARLASAEKDPDREYTKSRGGRGKIAVVVVSSNSGMCGAFNANVLKELHAVMGDLPKERWLLFPVGKKVREAMVKAGYTVAGNFDHLVDKLKVEHSEELSTRMMELFRTGEVERVEVVYHHFKSMASQKLIRETYLPFSLEGADSEAGEGALERALQEGVEVDNTILEPNRTELLNSLLPVLLHVKLRTIFLDSFASEQGARTVAMQMASDNANEILDNLQMEYNKLRQQGITMELLDIIGGSFV